MKFLCNSTIYILVIVSISGIGCVHRIPLTYQEYCGQQGLVFNSVRDDSGSARAYNYRTQSVVRASSFNRSISCERPKSEVDNCEIESTGQAGILKSEYNSGVLARNYLIGAGYFLWVLPGVAAYYYYDSKRDSVLENIEAQRLPATTCYNDENVSS